MAIAYTKSPVITAGQKKKTTYGPGTTNKTAQTTQNTPFQAAASPTKNTPFQAAAYPGAQNQTETTQKSQYLTGYSPSQFQTSSMTDRYLNHLDDLENSKPAAFQSQYSNEIQNILNTIQNRPKFNTDDVFKSDLYTTMREQAIQNGQKSMRDTMGAAQAATGGYGSTYAQAAGQQAYDNVLSNFNNTTLDILLMCDKEVIEV